MTSSSRSRVAGRRAILNVLSVLSWVNFLGSTSYSAAKAAQWSLTNGIRLEPAEQGSLVTGLAMASTDTDMMAGFDGPKNDPHGLVVGDAAVIPGREPGACSGPFQVPGR